MGHNSVVSGHSKSTGIPRVDGLSTRPPDLGCHMNEVVAITWEQLMQISEKKEGKIALTTKTE